MEAPIKNLGGCPYEKANIFSKIFFCFAFPLLKKGAKQELNHESMYTCVESEKTQVLWEKLDRSWKKELEKKRSGGTPSLRMALARAYGLYYAITGIIVLLEDLCRLVSPVLLQWLLDYYSPDSNTTRAQAYLYAMGIGLSALFQAVLSPNIVFYLPKAGLQWQAGVSAMIYRKALRLSNNAASVTSSGHIGGLMSTDAEKLIWNVWFLHFWRGLLQSGFALWYTYTQIGVVVFTAVGYVVLMVLFQAGIAKLIAIYREKSYKVMDERVNIIGEIVASMRVIKMYCWEKPFGEIVAEIRKKEVALIWRTYNFVAVLAELYTFNQRCLTAVIVLVYVYLEGTLSAAKVFPMFTFFGLMSLSTLDLWVWGIKTWLETGVSVHRIEKFLLLEERGDETVHRDTYVHKVEGSAAVMATHVKATWSLDDVRPTLSDLSFSVGKGELLTVVGEVGCGKSSLLLAVCGELPVSSGSLFCGGRIAYTSQQPWVFAASIRQNILFGREYDEQRYTAVLAACSLNQDLSILPHGDETLVGDKGVTLSGGQKARVGLARAVYAQAEVYLLDDPLSAVDTHVGRDLFQNCIKTLLKDKAVILVTHQLQYLQESDKILVMHQGETQAYGTFPELLQSGIDFTKLLHKRVHKPSVREPEQEDREEEEEEDSEEEEVEDTEEQRLLLKKQVEQRAAQVREEEDRAVGTVSWGVYWQYFSAGGNVCALVCIFLLNVLTQALYNGGDWWLSVWSDADDRYSNETHFPNGTFACNKTMPWDCLDTATSGYIYVGFLGLMFVVGLARTSSMYLLGIRCSRTLHRHLYSAVVRAPIRFHDTNPKGRIMNRFSGDISTIDNSIADVIEDFLQTTFIVVGSVAVMCALNPLIALLILPMLLMLAALRRFYLSATRQVRRIQSSAHSPMLSHLTATLDGIHTIRAFNNQPILIRDADGHYDALTGTWFTSMCVFTWFFFGISLVSGVFNVLATFACLLVKDFDLISVETGQIGLILSYITSLMYVTQHAVRLSADVELQMVSAERVIRYSKIEPEAELETPPDVQPPSQWPDKGHIVFDHVSFAYSTDSPLVLKNIYCEIQPCEKIGIAGRTGAGKSSLIHCLFRMAEPMGQIRIDDVAINELGLHAVRSAIAIIPQDPVMFSGTVRRNLDPFDEMPDHLIWNALEEVQLRPVVSALPEGLGSAVTESGANFSVGQRQLFCLARAVLRGCKVLLLDEATANVDKRTDELIQRTIRTRFADCTVLTVAHRLHTIMDSDRIMVIDSGQIVEFDTPFRLLQNKDGFLYQMSLQTGLTEHRRLYELAEAAHVTSMSLTG